MPDQSSAATEHAILQEITAPLSTLPDDPVSIVHADFPAALRGYDRMAVDAYVKQISQLVAELQATRSPDAAVRRALERVGEQISGILQRAHETAEQITSQSRAEAEDRLEQARQEAAQITADAEQRVKDLDVDTDRIWAERHRIVSDSRELAAQLVGLADSAAERFPPAEEPERHSAPYDDQAPHDEHVYEDDGDAATVAFPAVEPRSGDAPGAQFADEDAAAEYVDPYKGQAAAESDYGDAAAGPDYRDVATEPDYGDASAEPDAYGDAGAEPDDYGDAGAEPDDYGDAGAELPSGDSAFGLHRDAGTAKPPPVAGEDRPGEHDSTAVIPPASQAAHRRAGS